MGRVLETHKRDQPTETDQARVLVVEGDKTVRNSFVRSLERRGLRVDTASTRAEAVQLAERHAYPVIVADPTLSPRGSVSLVTELRSFRPEASFIITTGADGESGAELPTDEAITCVLRKPWSERQLRTALESARESYRIRQQSLLPADGKTYDVMLIDADIDSTQRLLALLQQSGVAREIQHCPAVSQAISVLQTRPFDVILVNDQSLGSERLGELDLLRGAHKNLAVIALSNRIADGQRPLRTRRNGKSKANTLPDDTETLRRILLGGIDRKQKEASAASAAPSQLDGLTQLASADAFGDLLEACVTQCRRTKTSCAVLLINLAHFKGVNASFGQEAGDTVLCEVGRRIQASVREEDSVARLGADDYAVLLTQIESAEVSTRVAQRILGITGLPVLLRDDLEVRLRAHVGISMYPDCSDSSDELLCHARDALNAAKTEKLGFVLFSRGQTRQP